MNMIKSLLLGIAIFFTTTLQAHSISDQTLVTIHGFLGSPWHMLAMTKGYESEGVKVIQIVLPRLKHEVVAEGHTSILSSFWVYQIAKAFFKRDF